jgi:hypothetical protein
VVQRSCRQPLPPRKAFAGRDRAWIIPNSLSVKMAMSSPCGSIDQHALDSHSEEQYVEEREDEPISKFGADIGLTFYDHDFMEIEH